MRPKIKSFKETLGIGVHHVVVKSMSYARNAANQKMIGKDGAPVAMDVVFKETAGNGLEWKERFWLSTKAHWRVDLFAKAIKANLTAGNQTPVTEIINIKKLFIVIGKLVYVSEDRQTSMSGGLTLVKFAMDMGVPPTYTGSPDPNNPTGIFLQERSYEEFIERQNAKPKSSS